MWKNKLQTRLIASLLAVAAVFGSVPSASPAATAQTTQGAYQDVAVSARQLFCTVDANAAWSAPTIEEARNRIKEATICSDNYDQNLPRGTAAGTCNVTVTGSGPTFSVSVTDGALVNPRTGSCGFTFPAVETSCQFAKSPAGATTGSVTVSVTGHGLSGDGFGLPSSQSLQANGAAIFNLPDQRGMGRQAYCASGSEVTTIDRRKTNLDPGSCISPSLPNPSTWYSSFQPSGQVSVSGRTCGSCTTCSFPTEDRPAGGPGLGQGAGGNAVTLTGSNSCDTARTETMVSGGEPYVDSACTARIQQHWDQYGQYENRGTSPYDDPNAYLGNWGDLQSAFGCSVITPPDIPTCSPSQPISCSNSASCTSPEANVDQSTPSVAASPTGFAGDDRNGNFAEKVNGIARSIKAVFACQDGLSGCTGFIASRSGQTLSASFSDAAGNTSTGSASTGPGFDTTAPVLITQAPEPFAASLNPPPTYLRFQDGGGSGFRSAEITVLDPDNQATFTLTRQLGGRETAEPLTIPIVGASFTKAGIYKVKYKVCDVASNCVDTERNFWHVTANVPVLTAANCSGTNHRLACPGGFAFPSSSQIMLGDGEKYHTVELRLTDAFGNRIRSENGIKEVWVKLFFDNTTRLDQIARTGDSTIFTVSSDELAQLLPGLPVPQDPGGTEFPAGANIWLAEKDIGDTAEAGLYRVQVKSYAPTSTGYTPIANDGFNLKVNRAEVRVRNLNNLCFVGQTTPNGTCY